MSDYRAAEAKAAYEEAIAAAERRTWARAIEVLRAVDEGLAADYLAKHPDPAPKPPLDAVKESNDGR